MNAIPGGRAHELTQQILQHAGIADSEHTLLADNLSNTISKLPEAMVERFEGTHGDVASVLPDVINEAAYSSPAAWRPLEKLQRDVARPYTNGQVLERAKAVEGKLKDALVEHQRLNGSYPQRVWVVGSLVRGGFGGNSDADVLLDGGQKPVKMKLDDPDHMVEVMYLRHGEEAEQLRYFGSVEEIDPSRLLKGESVLTPMLMRSLASSRHTVTL